MAFFLHILPLMVIIHILFLSCCFLSSLKALCGHSALQIILAREYLKEVSLSREQTKYLVLEALRSGCQVVIIITYPSTHYNFSITNCSSVKEYDISAFSLRNLQATNASYPNNGCLSES